MMLNYNVVLVSDANATWTDEQHNATLTTMVQNFGDVMTTDEVLERLVPAKVPAARERLHPAPHVWLLALRPFSFTASIVPAVFGGLIALALRGHAGIPTSASTASALL